MVKFQNILITNDLNKLFDGEMENYLSMLVVHFTIKNNSGFV